MKPTSSGDSRASGWLNADESSGPGSQSTKVEKPVMILENSFILCERDGNGSCERRLFISSTWVSVQSGSAWFSWRRRLLISSQVLSMLVDALIQSERDADDV